MKRICWPTPQSNKKMAFFSGEASVTLEAAQGFRRDRLSRTGDIASCQQQQLTPRAQARQGMLVCTSPIKTEVNIFFHAGSERHVDGCRMSAETR